MNNYENTQLAYSCAETGALCDASESKSETVLETDERQIESAGRGLTALRFALFGANASARIVYLNSVWPVLTGIRIEDCLGRTLSGIFPDPVNSDIVKELHEALISNRVVRGELTIHTPHGRQVRLEVSARSKVDSGQKIVGITGRFTDISARKHWQKRTG